MIDRQIAHCYVTKHDGQYLPQSPNHHICSFAPECQGMNVVSTSEVTCTMYTSSSLYHNLPCLSTSCVDGHLVPARCAFGNGHNAAKSLEASSGNAARSSATMLDRCGFLLQTLDALLRSGSLMRPRFAELAGTKFGKRLLGPAGCGDCVTMWVIDPAVWWKCTLPQLIMAMVNLA